MIDCSIDLPIYFFFLLWSIWRHDATLHTLVWRRRPEYSYEDHMADFVKSVVDWNHFGWQIIKITGSSCLLSKEKRNNHMSNHMNFQIEIWLMLNEKTKQKKLSKNRKYVVFNSWLIVLKCQYPVYLKNNTKQKKKKKIGEKQT